MYKSLSNRPLFWLSLGIFAFIIRLAFVFYYPVTQPAGTYAYDAQHTDLFSGKGYEVHARTLYIAYTKISYKLFGPSHLPIILGNIIMGSLTVIIIGQLSKYILLKPSQSIYPAILTAFNPIFIFWVGYIFPETMFMLLFSTCLWLSFTWLNNPSKMKLFGLIVLSLLLIFTRAHGIVIVPLLWLWLIATRYRIPLLAWYNRRCLNRSLSIILISVVVTFFINLVVATIINIHRPAIERNWPFTWLMGEHEAQNEMHKRLFSPDQPELVRQENKPLIMQDAYSLKEHIRIAGIKTKFFWIPIRRTFSLKHIVINLTVYSLIYTLAIIGWFLLWKRRKDTLIFFLAIFIAFTITIIICFPDSEGRYRLPCDLLLIIIAGEALGFCCEKLRCLFYKVANLIPVKLK